MLPLEHNGHGGVTGLVDVDVGEQRNHTKVACYREDVDGRGGFLADVDLLVGYVVADGQCLGGDLLAWSLAQGTRDDKGSIVSYGCDANPAGEEEAGVLEAAGEGEDGGGDVGVDGVDSEEADHCSLGSVVDEPMLGIWLALCPQCRSMGNTYQRDMRQSVKKKDRYPEAKHHIAASAVSVSGTPSEE